jgi:hypothetical protein
MLRTQVANYLPEDAVQWVDNSIDESIGCGTDDPDGLMRQWHSAVTIAIDEDADDSQVQAKNLAFFLEPKGWSVSDKEGSTVTTRVLTSERSHQQLRIVSTDNKEGGTLTVDVIGECVRTDGADSDEVRGLTPRT